MSRFDWVSMFATIDIVKFRMSDFVEYFGVQMNSVMQTARTSE